MTIFKKTLLFACLTLAVSCARQYKITERAQKQLPVSLNEEFPYLVEGYSDLEIQNLKTVYENDSICMLQFTAAYKDTLDEDKILDLRYIYIYDTFMSRMMKQRIFNDEFREIPCMPDEKIMECKKEVKKNKESVYDSMIGSTHPVNTPFDKQ